MGGELAHAPAAARRTDAPLTGKGDENLSLATAAPKTRKAAGHHATGDELTQFAFHEARQALATATCARLGQKGLEVLADHLAQDGLLGLATDMRMARSAERGFPGCRKLLGNDILRRRARTSRQAGHRRPLAVRHRRHEARIYLRHSIIDS